MISHTKDSFNNVPLAAKILSFSGLIPFLACTYFEWSHFVDTFNWLEAHLTYSAVILSFLGGLHWAFAMTLTSLNTRAKNFRFIWGVIPSLIAWLSFGLHPLEANVLLVIGFLLQLWQDMVLHRSTQLPKWYLPLRIKLTAVVCLSLVSAILSIFFS
jgi:hypothetical protein